MHGMEAGMHRMETGMHGMETGRSSGNKHEK